MMRTALLILSGNAFASVLLLVRNLLVARMIPVADYGVASTFAVAMAVVEMASALGLQQQIIQAREGDDPDFQAALQGFQVLRGVMSGAALFLIAGPMADFMAIPEVTWAYRMLALVPVLNALVHFDIHRLNRHMIFWPMLVTGALPALISVLVLWPLAHWFGDWRVMLYAILIQVLLAAVVSHLVARRPYRLRFDPAVMAGALRFGWPLLVNAVLLFFVFQGDRLIVARLLGMVSLAIFSMGVTLTLTPTLVVAKSVQNLLLPALSAAATRRPAGRKAFDDLVTATLKLHFLSGSALVLGTALLGPVLVHLLLGPRYADLVPILTLLAIQQGLRLFKGGPATVALATGQTGNAMIANFVRVGFLPLGYAIAARTGQIDLLIFTGIVAEAAGLVVAIWVASARIAIPVRPFLPALCSSILVLAATYGVPRWSGLGVMGSDLVMAMIFLASLSTMASLTGTLTDH